MVDFTAFRHLIDEYEDNEDLHKALDKIVAQYEKEIQLIEGASPVAGKRAIRCNAMRHRTPEYQFKEAEKSGHKLKDFVIITSTNWAVITNSTLIIDDGVEL